MSTSIAYALLTSCSNEEPIFKTTESEAITTDTNSAIRSVDEAIDLVTEYYGSIIGERASRAALDIDRSNVIALGPKHVSRSNAADTALYVINFGDNSGFAVVTADKSLTPILAMTESGEITDIDNIEVPGLKAFMQASMTYASASEPQGSEKTITPPVIKPDQPVNKLYRGEVVYKTAYEHTPEVNVSWGEVWPTGYYCPNQKAGCVVTAALQALSRFEYPKLLRLTYNDRDMEYVSINWPTLKNNVGCRGYIPPTLDRIRNLEDCLTLGRVSRQIGELIGADYTNQNFTKASLGELRNTLKSIAPNISYSDITYSAPNISNIPTWNVIMMTGREIEDDENTSHCWLIDGCKYENWHVYVYVTENPRFDDEGNFIPSGEPVESYNQTIYTMSHINWGWGGYYDGYYDVGVYDIEKCKERDLPFSTYGADYKYDYITSYFTMYKAN